MSLWCWLKALFSNIHMTEKRCNRCKIIIDCKYKTCDERREFNRQVFWNRTPEARQVIRERVVHKYRTNEAWRIQKISEASALLKSTVVCSEGDKVMNYGSWLPHKNAAGGEVIKQHWKRYSSCPLMCARLLNIMIVTVD